METLNHQELKAYQRAHRDQWQKGLSLRVHRALSWLKKAEHERANNDPDSEFIFLWIAFNAAYASQYTQESRTREKEAFDSFLERIVSYDTNKQLYELIWTHYSNAIRSLMDNPYVYQPFWDCMNKAEPSTDWESSFSAAKRASHQALATQNVAQSLAIVLSRLYTLRNQLMHGGATWQGQLNREQLKDATAILRSIVPIVINIMMQHGKEHWAEAVYFIDEGA